MHETDAELAALQRLLDDSHRHAGAHLRSIFRDDRRLTASRVAELLPGVQILSLATVTADCRPLVGPVDGLFFRGHFHFGSSEESVRFRHLRARPQVSAAHVRGEELAVIVHGTAVEIDVGAPEHSGFRDYLVEVYGEGWTDWGSGAPYARIDATRMFAVLL
jgi:hypothetical protein